MEDKPENTNKADAEQPGATVEPTQQSAPETAAAPTPTVTATQQAQPAPATPAASSGPVIGPSPKKSRKKLWITLIVIVVLLLAGGGAYWFMHQQTAKPAKAPTTVHKSTTSAPKVEGLQLDTSKNYGDKYKDGILPVGDGKYSTTATSVGTVYACSQYANSLSSGQGGASSRGPWFQNNNTQYDINKKTHVSGSVMWQASFTNTVNGTTRTIVTNDLPSHPTGVFPIMSTDPAYAYDHNPNTIKSQSLTYALNANPTYGSPNCMGGEAGIMLTGVALFNAFDAGGRDAGAWEVQDSCSGHPQSDGVYHYHALSTCIKDTSVHTVIGYALDGFPITGPQVGPNNILTTADLDVCHGLTSTVQENGKSVTTYHYVMTQDFPYSVSCFRGTAIQPPDLENHTANQGGGANAPSGAQPTNGPPPKQ